MQILSREAPASRERRPPYAWPDPDREYSNRSFIPGGGDYVRVWAKKASAFRTTPGLRAELDVHYGTRESQRLDLFFPQGSPRGVMIFVHGGYWHLLDKSYWSHLACGGVGSGFAVAILGYSSVPETRLSQITLEVAQACRLVETKVGGPMVITGHSAGGHLAARMACPDILVPIRRVVPISPLSELGPLLATKMNVMLRIDESEAALESPARLGLRPGVSAEVWVGGEERPAFLWQARTLSEEWGCRSTIQAERHHFNVIEGLEDPSSSLCRSILDGI